MEKVISKSCLTPEIRGQLSELRRILFVICVFLSWGAAPVPHASLVAKELPSPAGKGSLTPYIYSAGERLVLSWQQQAKNGVEMHVAGWKSASWSPAHTIVAGAPLFHNWADFPSILVLTDGSLAAHWLQKSGPNNYSYDTMVSVSRNDGLNWSAPVKPHHDRPGNEHGFASLVPLDQNRFMCVWLDSRNFKNHDDEEDKRNEMQLMAGVYQSGKFSAETILDPRTCDCCQTTAVRTPDGVFVAYRDRSEKDIRDISYVRYSHGKWSAPKVLYPDDWEITGCPVNGPAAAVLNQRLIVAWFTAADDKPRVKAILSNNGGKTFGKVFRIDEGNPTGRVDAKFLPDGSAVVSWVENSETTGARVQVRRVFKDGTLDTPLVVTQANTDRAGGFPRMARYKNGVMLAWTDLGKDDSRIRVVSIQPR